MDCVLPPGNSIEGVVVDHAGAPIPGIRVQALAPGRLSGSCSCWEDGQHPSRLPGPRREAISGPDGTFRLSDLPPGEVTFSRNGFIPVCPARNYPIGEFASFIVHAQANPGEIRARVIDAKSGEPVEEYVVATRHSVASWIGTSPHISHFFVAACPP